MAKSSTDPIDTIRVFLSEDGSISFDHSDEAKSFERADSLRKRDALNEGEGFRILVFNDRARFKGACDMTGIFHDTQDNMGFCWRTDGLPGGLHALAFRMPYDAAQVWDDLRGDLEVVN
jgi:hypothetical protein